MALGSGITTILHAVLLAFLILELGLTAFLSPANGTFVNETNDLDLISSPSQFNFMLFNSIWSLILLAYISLIPRFLERLYHRQVAFGLMAVTTLFWFAGSIAMAVFVGVPTCSSFFCTAVRSAKAAIAFGFFIWLIFTGLTVFEGMATLRGGARADTASKPVV